MKFGIHLARDLSSCLRYGKISCKAFPDPSVIFALKVINSCRCGTCFFLGAWPGQGRLIGNCQRSQPTTGRLVVCLSELRAKWVKCGCVRGAIYARRVYSFTILLCLTRMRQTKQTGKNKKQRQNKRCKRRVACCDQGRSLSRINFNLKSKRKRCPLYIVLPPPLPQLACLSQKSN